MIIATTTSAGAVDWTVGFSLLAICGSNVNDLFAGATIVAGIAGDTNDRACTGKFEYFVGENNPGVVSYDPASDTVMRVCRFCTGKPGTGNSGTYKVTGFA